MNYNYLRYFSVLAQLEHYSLAAARLEISQPSLSVAIRTLEDELGVPLFEKHGRNIRLTEYGRYYKERVDRALGELGDAARVLRLGHEKERTTLRIGYVSSALETLLIPRILQCIRAEKDLAFRLTEGNSSRLVDMLLREELDAIICTDRLRDRTLHFRKLGEIGYCVFVPAGHPLAGQESVDMDSLRAWPLIGYNSSAGPSVEARAREDPGEHGLVCEVNTAAAGLRLAEAGAGLVIVPDIPAFTSDTLLRIPLRDHSRSLYLCTLHDKWLEPVVWDFVEQLAKSRIG